jgi:hypothetical protein
MHTTKWVGDNSIDAMAKYKTEGVNVGSVTASLTVKGPEDEAEKVKMHAHDELVKAMQAFDEGKHPDECDGLPFSVAWERVIE